MKSPNTNVAVKFKFYAILQMQNFNRQHQLLLLYFPF